MLCWATHTYCFWLFMVMTKRGSLADMSGLTLERVISRMWIGRPWTKSYTERKKTSYTSNNRNKRFS